MTPTAVTADLLHHLLAGSHAEGTTRLGVAAVIDHDDRILLIAQPDGDFNESFELPSDLVLPGETLLDALHRTVSSTGLESDEVTGYLGHHDHHDGETTRVFSFTVTVTDPHRICRAALIGHYWADPDQRPDLPAPAAQHHPTWAPATLHKSAEPPLAEPLRACARGVDATEAGVELLIRHATWLHRSDFRDRFVHTGTGITGATELARIDWAAAITALDTGELPCSGGEGRMLRLAASLVDGIPVDLRDALTSLDTRNTDLVSRAVPHANGRRP